MLLDIVLFQLTRPRGTRRNYRTFDSRRSSFNSRVRGGRDRVGTSERRTGQCFNSRVRGGRDVMSVMSPSLSYVSTHASAGDATGKACDEDDSDKFQLTRPRGTRLGYVLGATPLDVSTHASAGDATRRVIWLRLQPCFNSRVRGGRDPQGNLAAFATVFQLTRPRGTRPAG